MLPAWAVLTANVAFYGWMLWLCTIFPRALRGKERVLIAGWVPGLLLSPIQGLVSAPFADAIQYVKALSIFVAFTAAMAVLVKGPVNDKAAPDGTLLE